MLEWQRKENRRIDYIPPVVVQGVVTEAQFWEMAHANSLLRIEEIRNNLYHEQACCEYAFKRLAQCQGRFCAE